MAKAAWLSVVPNSGTGNATVVNQASVHTGREQRTTTVTGVATGVMPNKTYEVIQKAKQEFVSFNDGLEIAVGKDGGTVTLTGKSNSSKLSFSVVKSSDNEETEGVVEGGLNFNISPNYNVNGASTPNNTEIIGDPGASAEYEFSVQLTDIAKNTSIKELTAAVLVTAAGGQTAQITVKQTAGEPTFAFSVETITLEADGSEVNVNIESNTSWELQ